MKALFGLLAYIRNYKRYVWLNIISNLLMVVFSVVSIPSLVPFLRLLFDRDIPSPQPPEAGLSGMAAYLAQGEYQFLLLIQNEGREKALLYTCLFIITLFFFKNFFRFLSLYFMAPVRTGIVRDIRQSLYDKLTDLPLSFFSQERKGDLISRMTSDVQEVEWSVLNVLEAIIRDPLMIIGCLAYMVYVSPTLTVFVFLMVIVMGGLIGLVGSSLRKGSAEAQGLMGQLVAVVEESLSGLRIIKAFNAEDYRGQAFAQKNNAYRNTLIPVFRRRDLSSPLSEFLGIVVVAVLLQYGAGFVFDGQMSPETFLTFLFAFYSIIPPAKSLSRAYYNIRKGMAASDRITRILSEENPIQDPPNPLPLSVLREGFKLEKVSFSYDEETQVLQDIDLEIPKDKVVALVGSSGGGKTTISDLLPRFYDVTAGRILLDGNDIRNYKMADLRSLFGMVSQEAILFNDTIYNNIIFGREGFSREQVEQAARIANAHDFIMETEQGYQTSIGDRGSKLSGGQRQRITIARAILGNPPVLILDEATSALDSESEQAVQEALAKVMENRTVLVIAHRLSTIRHADIIVVMQQGSIEEQGTHAELIARKGIYEKLVRMQAI